MNKKSILICESCFSRNYHFLVRENAIKRLSLKKYCSTCNLSQWHHEHK